MLAIKNTTLVMPDHLIPDATLLCEDGKILDFGTEVEIPADAVWLTDRGQIRKGLRADFVLCDHNLSVKQVILQGNVIS